MKHTHITTYRGHAIYATKTDGGDLVFMYAKKRNGTDEYFVTYEQACDDIDRLEDSRKEGRKA